MFTGRQKIVKANGAEPDEFEASVAQELFNLEVKEFCRGEWTEIVVCERNRSLVNRSRYDVKISHFGIVMLCLKQKVSASELKADLHDLYISAAKELELDGGRKAIIIFVPFRQLKDFHKIQSRLVRELEKKFRYSNVIYAAVVSNFTNRRRLWNCMEKPRILIGH